MRDIPNKANVTVKGTMAAITKAGRSPRKMNMTTSTTAKVCATLDKALLIDWVTLVS